MKRKSTAKKSSASASRLRASGKAGAGARLKVGRKAEGGLKANARKRPLRLLAGGNPQMAKADGDGPVQAYISAIPVGWKREVARQLDALVTKTVPAARKAVKWNSPFYGIEGRGWFASFHVFTHYVKLTFFKGTSLTPAPAGGGGQQARWIDVHEDDLDAAQLASWLKQAAALPGWGGG